MKNVCPTQPPFSGNRRTGQSTKPSPSNTPVRPNIRAWVHQCGPPSPSFAGPESDFPQKISAKIHAYRRHPPEKPALVRRRNDLLETLRNPTKNARSKIISICQGPGCNPHYMRLVDFGAISMRSLAFSRSSRLLPNPRRRYARAAPEESHSMTTQERRHEHPNHGEHSESEGDRALPV